MGTTGALGKRKIELTKEADVSIQSQMNGGTVLSAGATSKAEPSFESKDSSNSSPAFPRLALKMARLVQILSAALSVRWGAVSRTKWRKVN